MSELHQVTSARTIMDHITIENTTVHDIISNNQFLIVLDFCAVTWTLFSVLGIISNVINIKIFLYMGLKDGITVSFLALSIFDLTYVIASFCIGISAAFTIIEMRCTTRFPAEPYGIMILFANILVLIAVTNVLATTFLAVARCMCVAKPLNFKNCFTVKKTVYFMAGFAIFAVAIYTPILANMGMVTTYNNKTHMSRRTLWVSKYKEPIKNVVFLIIDMILPVSTQFIVLACILIMANSLRAASRFRQASNQIYAKEQPDIGSHCRRKATSSTDVTDKLSGKDFRVVTQVILISVVYIICNTPKIFISTAGLLEQQFRIGKRYNNFYISLNSFRKHLEIFNASINTFIYYKYNTKFRNTLQSNWK